jgi:NitT/TauT family transport system ATP-binding protein
MQSLPQPRPPLRAVAGEPVYELTGVGKTYARNAVTALEGSPDADQGQLLVGHRVERLRQVHASEDHGGADPALRGARGAAGASPVTGPRRDIGMMFQQATLFPWRTTIENVVLPIEIRDGKRAAQAARDQAAGAAGAGRA